MASWGKDFTPKAFKGTQEQPGLTTGQNESILKALGGLPSAGEADTAKRSARADTHSAPRAQPPPPRAPRPPEVRPLAPVPRSTAPQTAVASRSVVDPSTLSAEADNTALRRQVEEATHAVQAAKDTARLQVQAAEQRTAQEREARLRAEQVAQQTREELTCAKVAPVAARAPNPARGAVHEKLTPKLMRFPPLLLDRLASLALAYGLDQTSTVRLALTELYERAVAAGTVPS